MDAERGFISNQVRSGMLWVTGISLFRDILQFGVMLVLVRLVDPKAYGEFSVANSIVAVFTVISFHSFIEHTLQVRPDEPVDYQAHFTFGAFTQWMAVIALNLVALTIDHFPRYAGVARLLTVMSVFFILDWFGELRVKMLERRLNWSRLRLLEAVGLLANSVAAIALAVSGAGVYALAIPALLISVPFIYDLLWVARWRPEWTLNWQAFQPAWRYGLTRIASGLVARGQQLMENSFLAALLGLATLGIYGRAVGLASLCCLKLTSLMTVTIFPVMTRFEPGSPQFRRAGGLVLRAIAWTAIPTAALFSLLASPVVKLLYGKNWLQTVPLLPWAMANAALAALMEASAFLLLTSLHPSKTLAIDVLNLAGTGLSLLLLLPHGLIPYMEGILLLQAGLTMLALIGLAIDGNMDVKGIFSAFAAPVLSVAAIAGANAALIRSVSEASLSVQGAIAFAIVSVAIYAVALRVFAARELLELLEFVPAAGRMKRIFRLDREFY